VGLRDDRTILLEGACGRPAEEGRMRVSVDESKCEAYGVCAVDAPAVFELDEAGYAHVVMDEVPAEMADLARRAAIGCPMGAITVEDS